MTINTLNRVNIAHSTHDYTKEILRASEFLVRQIQKGYTPQEAFVQVEGSYGYKIMLAVMQSLRRVL